MRDFCLKHKVGLQLVPFWPHLWLQKRLKKALKDIPVISFEGPWSRKWIWDRLDAEDHDFFATYLNDVLFGLPWAMNRKIKTLSKMFPAALEIDTGRGCSVQEIGKDTDLVGLSRDTPLVLDSWYLGENIERGRPFAHREHADSDYFKVVDSILSDHNVVMIHLQTRSKKMLSDFLTSNKSLMAGFLARVLEHNPNHKIIIELPPGWITKDSSIIQRVRKLAKQ